MLAKTRILSVSDYIALAIVAVIGIAGGLYVLRAARQRRIKRRDAAAAVDEMIAFQAAQIVTGTGDGVDLKSAIEEGRR